MKGDTCGFLHQFDPQRMPVCRTLLKFGVCKEPDCPYKHTLEEIKECNMYKLGFCIYGPAVRAQPSVCCDSSCAFASASVTSAVTLPLPLKGSTARCECLAGSVTG